MKNILITNDDGILASGLVRLAKAAESFGNVTVIAPEKQRSALSHSITLRETIDVYPFDFPVPGITAWACTGTPADCVRLGIHHLLSVLPDAVISGINFGYNIGSDIQYSATVGAAMETAHMGILSIALSEATGETHEITDAYLLPVLEELLSCSTGRDEILNVNFPRGSLADCRGILRDRKVSANGIFLDHYRITEELPGGRIRLAVNGIPNEESDEDTDLRALTEGYISVGRIRNIGGTA